jgi:uncharacterized membrane protein YtjA (UPF0391 family)
VHHACGACTLQVKNGRREEPLQSKLLILSRLLYRPTLAHFKPCNRENMLSWAVTILILAIVAALLATWGIAGMPGWVVRGLCLLVIILCIVAAFLA